jgi:hypothetical protein
MQSLELHYFTISNMDLEAANSPRVFGRRAGYEAWFLTVNDPSRRVGFWFRYTYHLGGSGSHAALWAFAFHRDDPARNTAAKVVLPAESLELRTPFRIQVGESFLDGAGCRGAFKGAAWELSWEPAPSPFPFLKPRWELISTVGNIAAQPRLRVSGKVRLGGRSYTLKGACGGQQHTWGSTHAREWNWGYASGAWGWVDGATSRVLSRLGRELRGTAAGALVEGETFALNGPLKVLRNPGSIADDEWLAELNTRKRALRVSVRPRREDLIGVTYEDPAGGVRYCYHTEVADLRLSLGGKAVIAEAAAAFEYASEKPLEGVEVRL